MKRFLLLFLLFPFFSCYSISSVQGISYSYALYFFYIDEPSRIEYEDMFFTVSNTEDVPILVNCTFKEKYGVNITIDLEWQTKLLQPAEKSVNHYIIIVNDVFSRMYELEIDVVGYSSGEGDIRIFGGGTVVCGVTYYGEDEGYYLDFDITDQAEHPRECEVIIRYKSYLYADYMSFTPLMAFNGSGFQGYFPAGHYQIFAQDIETNWVVEESFELNNDTYKNLVLELVRFDFIPIFDDENNLGVNISILNRLEVLSEVDIYAEVYKGDDKISETNKEFRSEFLKSKDFRLELWFKAFRWRTGEYKIIGYIDSNQEHIAFKTYILNWKEPSDLLGGAIVFGVIALGVVIVIQQKYKKKTN